MLSLVPQQKRRFTDEIRFREDREVLQIVRRIASKEGLQDSSLLRQAIRSWLRNRPDLTKEEKRILDIGNSD